MNSSEQQQRQEDPPREHVYVDPERMHRLRKIAQDKGSSVQQLVEAGIDSVLRTHGEIIPARDHVPSTEEQRQDLRDRDPPGIKR